jgi:RPA43 OB domain in RNA Pol I
MGKRKSHEDETPEERNERKRLKKKSNSKKQHSATTTTRTSTSSTTTTTAATAITSTTTAITSSQTASSSPSPTSFLYYKKKLQISISILPCGLRNVIESATESIRHALLLKYCNPMGGILLAFDNVQVVNNNNINNKNNNGGHGRILDELPHIHYNVTCNGLVFCPTIGLRIDGGTVVEASFHSHLSLVVHGHFNASISSNQMRKSGFAYDDKNHGGGQWFHVASQTYLQQQQQDNNTALREADHYGDDDDEDAEANQQRPPASRIQFTLHKLHEVGTLLLVCPLIMVLERGKTHSPFAQCCPLLTFFFIFSFYFVYPYTTAMALYRRHHFHGRLRSDVDSMS